MSEQEKPRQELTKSTKPHEPWMCKAHRSDGELCRKPAIEGSSVCLTHGAAAPQVRAAAKHRTELLKARAQGRLEAMIDGAISRIDELAKQSEHLPTSFNAAKHILDRGLGAVGADGKQADARPLIQIGIGIGDSLRAEDITIVETRPELPAAEIIDATVDDEAAG